MSEQGAGTWKLVAFLIKATTGIDSPLKFVAYS